jgi:ribonuclease III
LTIEVWPPTPIYLTNEQLEKQVMDIQQFQQKIGLKFTDDTLLKQALTHRSYVNEHGETDMNDNERLEFLGDAVLDFMVGDMLFQRYPDMPEGQLTRLRAALVRTEALASLSRQIGLGAAMWMGKGEEASGGRERTTNLCAGFEALIGALYLDKGLDAVRVFVTPQLDSLLTQILAESLDKDARSLLQEWSQAERNLTPSYRTVSATGPDHEKEFIIEVLIGEQIAGRGTGRSKQSASQAAAREALKRIEHGDMADL